MLSLAGLDLLVLALPLGCLVAYFASWCNGSLLSKGNHKTPAPCPEKVALTLNSSGHEHYRWQLAIHHNWTQLLTLRFQLAPGFTPVPLLPRCPQTSFFLFCSHLGFISRSPRHVRRLTHSCTLATSIYRPPQGVRVEEQKRSQVSNLVLSYHIGL